MYILDALWRGQVNIPDRTVSPNSEYSKLLSMTADTCDKMRKEMSEAGRQFFDEFESLKADMGNIETEDAFIEGVRFGAKFMLDVIGDYHGQFQPTFGEQP